MIKRIVIVLTSIIILLLVWQISEDAVNRVRMESGRTGLEAFIPSPLTILKTFQNDGHIIFSETMFTLERAGIGFLLGTVFAFLMATLFLLIPFLRNVFSQLHLR
jgi:ABC-type nitrate/sulfonate/bicarbonate transport system permease component